MAVHRVDEFVRHGISNGSAAAFSGQGARSHRQIPLEHLEWKSPYHSPLKLGIRPGGVTPPRGATPDGKPRQTVVKSDPNYSADRELPTQESSPPTPRLSICSEPTYFRVFRFSSA